MMNFDKSTILNFVAVLGIILIVSNNIIQFIDNVSQITNVKLAIIVLSTFGVLWNINIMKRLR